MASSSAQPTSSSDEARALALRLFMASLATAELMAAYLGIKLGLYTALSAGPANAGELAHRSGVAPRYVREWLEQQAAAGFVRVEDASKPATERVFQLPPGHAEALTCPDSPNWIAPMTVLPVGGLAPVLPLLLDAYRAGTGVPYSAYGDDFRGGQAGLNRSIFLEQLAPWIRSHLSDVHRTLLRPGGRIADVACGAGWSTIALSLAYPRAHVVGLDLDAASIADAQRNAKASGLEARVSFELRDAADPQLQGQFDLVCIFDSLHDMPQPVGVLAACNALRRPGAPVFLMEPRAAEHFGAPASEIERFLYAVSLLHCLPVGLHASCSAGTGTVLRPDTLRSYALEAGFAKLTVLPAEHRFHRLYRLD
jgi:2-polyprenyl-3-methyl-5-hydroxy-6-metoxy-1,4-benzoquinol methylase